MCIFIIIRTINKPTVNSTKFLLRVDISISSLALFFSDKLGNNRQDRTIFFSTKSVSDQKIRDFHVSDRGAPRIRQRRGHNRGSGGEAGKGGRFSQKKTLILAHFFNEKVQLLAAYKNNFAAYGMSKSRSMSKISERRLQPLSVWEVIDWKLGFSTLLQSQKRGAWHRASPACTYGIKRIATKSKSSLRYTRGITPKRVTNSPDPSPWLSAWATQLRRSVVAVASRWQHCADLTEPGFEPYLPHR